MNKFSERFDKSSIIKTGIDFLDDIDAVRYGKATVLAGTTASGKTTNAIQVAINLGVNDDKKVLYLSPMNRRFENQLMFLKMISLQNGRQLCYDYMEKVSGNKALADDADKYFDPDSIYSVSAVAVAIEGCNVDFMTFDGNDCDGISYALEHNDYDVIIIDSAYQITQDKSTQLVQQAFCTELCKQSYSQALIITAPIKYSTEIFEKGATIDDLTKNLCGKILFNKASTVLCLNSDKALCSDSIKPIIFKS